MRKRYVAALSVAIAAGPLCGVAQSVSVPAAGGKPQPVSFKDDVFPVFQAHCVSCHHGPDGKGYMVSGLDLTSYQGVIKGTKSGPMVVPGDTESNNLMRLIDWNVSPQLRMPHNKKQLSTDERDTIRVWI